MKEEQRNKIRDYIPDLGDFGVDKNFHWNRNDISRLAIEENWDDIMDFNVLFTITATDARLSDVVGLGYVFFQGKFLIIPYTDFGYDFEPEYYVYDRILNQGEIFDLFFDAMPDYGQPLFATPIFDRIKFQKINSTVYKELHLLFKEFLVV